MVTQLASGNGESAASFNTAAFAPGANHLALFAVSFHTSAGTTTLVPTISGGGMTAWTQVGSTIRMNGNTDHICLFRALQASPGAPAAAAISFGGTSVSTCLWGVADISGVDTTGTNGSGAIVQSASATGGTTSLTVTLAAFGSASNITYQMVMHARQEAQSATAPMTMLGQAGDANPGFGYQLGVSTGTDVTTPQQTWATSTAVNAGIAVEIKAAAAGPTYSGTPGPSGFEMCSNGLTGFYAPPASGGSTGGGLVRQGLQLIRALQLRL